MVVAFGSVIEPVTMSHDMHVTHVGCRRFGVNQFCTTCAGKCSRAVCHVVAHFSVVSGVDGAVTASNSRAEMNSRVFALFAHLL